MARNILAEAMTSRIPLTTSGGSRRELLVQAFSVGALSLLGPMIGCARVPKQKPKQSIGYKGEIDSLSRNQAMDYLLSTYKEQIDQVVDSVRGAVPTQFHDYVQDARINYSLDETPFAFLKDSESKTIHICLGGINALDISCVALAAALYVLEDPDWWLQYMLFHRLLRRQLGSVWQDPLDAAGITEDNVSRDAAQGMALFAYQSLGDMLTFVVAHEFGHVALKHSGEQGAFETRESYLARVREHELEADGFSFEVVKRLDSNPLAVVFSLLTHQVVFEEPDSQADSRHPPDWRRMTRAVEYFGKVKGQRSGKELQAATVLIKHLSGVESYRALDELGSRVSEQSLRRWPKR